MLRVVPPSAQSMSPFVLVDVVALRGALIWCRPTFADSCFSVCSDACFSAASGESPPALSSEAPLAPSARSLPQAVRPATRTTPATSAVIRVLCIGSPWNGSLYVAYRADDDG